jgi:NADH-quinone oxidoreductase subunit L
MRWPLVVLAVPSLLLGVTGLRTAWMPTWIDNGSALRSENDPFTREPFHLGIGTILGSLALAGAGAALAWFLWRRDPGADPARALGRARPAFARGFFVDDVYDAVLVRPTRVLARGVRSGDYDVVDAYVRGSGVGARLLGSALRLSQTGNVQTYLTGLLAGVVVLALAGAVAFA